MKLILVALTVFLCFPLTSVDAETLTLSNSALKKIPGNVLNQYQEFVPKLNYNNILQDYQERRKQICKVITGFEGYCGPWTTDVSGSCAGPTPSSCQQENCSNSEPGEALGAYLTVCGDVNSCSCRENLGISNRFCPAPSPNPVAACPP